MEPGSRQGSNLQQHLPPTHALTLARRVLACAGLPRPSSLATVVVTGLRGSCRLRARHLLHGSLRPPAAGAPLAGGG